jgi:hypothetical protein
VGDVVSRTGVPLGLLSRCRQRSPSGLIHQAVRRHVKVAQVDNK